MTNWENETSKALEQFTGVFDAAPIAMAHVRFDGSYVRANRALCELLGYSIDELAQLSFSGVTHPEDRAGDAEAAADLLSGAVKRAERHKRYIRKDGQVIHVAVYISLYRDANNVPCGFISEVVDMTAVKEAELALRTSRAQLSALIENAPDPILSMDRQGRIIAYNGAFASRMRSEFGIAEVAPGASFYSMLPPIERAQGLATHARVLAGEAFDTEYSRPAGEPYHVLASHYPIRDGGEIVGVTIMTKNITERRKTEVSLAKQIRANALLQRVAEAANEADSLNEVLARVLPDLANFTNWPVAHAFVLDRGELKSTKVWHLDVATYRTFTYESEGMQFVRGQDLPGRVLETKKPEWMDDVQNNPHFLRARAAYEHALVSGFAFPVLVRNEVAAVVEFFSDQHEQPTVEILDLMHYIGTQLGRVIEREAANTEIRALSLTDEMTGLHNRRGFTALANQHLRAALRSRTQSSVLFADLDGLKRINDELGHEAGDEAITHFARILRSTFRDIDIVARLGGDEFVVFICTNEANARNALARLQKNLAHSNASRPAHEPLEASFGLVSIEGDESLDMVLSRADALMYAAKRTKLKALRPVQAQHIALAG